MRAPLVLTSVIASLSGTIAHAQAVVHPIVIPKAEAAGVVFTQPGAVKHERNGHTTIDNILMKSSDQKMEAGMYQSGATHFEVKDRVYGVDEFMLFTSGSVTLTSIDGAVTKLNAGDAVVLPMEWKGTWDTPGYTKYYVIYSRTGKGM